MSHAVLLGPIKRDAGLTLADGTIYDVNDDHVVVESEAHAEELAHLVGLHYAQHGHPHHDDDKPFVYHPPEHFKGYEPHAHNKLKGK